MSRTTAKALLVASSFVCAMALGAPAQAVDQGGVISERVKKLTRAVKWTQVAAIPVNFNTYHPQGMVKIGDAYFVSTVDIRKPTTRYPPLSGRSNHAPIRLHRVTRVAVPALSPLWAAGGSSPCPNGPQENCRGIYPTAGEGRGAQSA